MSSNFLELLSPAGDLTRLKAAVDFGADAVYLAGEEFGMRTAAANFTREDLKAGVEYAHKNNALCSFVLKHLKFLVVFQF